MKEIRFRLSEKTLNSLNESDKNELRKTTFHLEKREDKCVVSWSFNGEITTTTYPIKEVEKYFKNEIWILANGTFPDIKQVISYLVNELGAGNGYFDDGSYLDIAKKIKDGFVYEEGWDITDDQLVEFATLILLIW